MGRGRPLRPAAPLTRENPASVAAISEPSILVPTSAVTRRVLLVGIATAGLIFGPDPGAIARQACAPLVQQKGAANLASLAAARTCADAYPHVLSRRSSTVRSRSPF